MHVRASDKLIVDFTTSAMSSWELEGKRRLLQNSQLQ